jgi:anion transporter
MADVAEITDVKIAVPALPHDEAAEQGSLRMKVGSLLGPLIGLAVWFVPTHMEPVAQHTLGIVAFMIVYWITEPIDHGITAMIGCFLFWALHIANFETAFAGFADSSPWFLFGSMLMGEAASQTGLAKRIGFIIMRYLGTSYSRLLLSVVVFSFVLNFLVPSGLAQIAIIAPMIIGIVAGFGVGPQSNIARGLFVILTYTCGLFNKMILAGGASILTRGIVEKLTGEPIYWSKYFIAYLPADLITIFACWLTILWLYPAEKRELPGGRKYLQDAVESLGPWTVAEKRTLALLLLAVALWATDLWHKTDPAVIALGVGLVVALPRIGVLKTKDIRRVNFLLIIFMAGALSMGVVLARTKALDVLTGNMMAWMTPHLGDSFHSASVLYWTGFAYHFVLASELSMLSTSLPILVNFAVQHGFNPIAFAMVWNFASGGKMFVYQSAVLILGYSYGYFQGKDLIRVGLVLTIVEGLILAFLVPFYWPLIGLHWVK